MAVKESSDEPNPAGVMARPVGGRLRAARSFTDYLAIAIATCGVGYLSLAPGTWGSLVGVGIYLLWQFLRVRFFLVYGDDHGIPLAIESLWTAFTLLLVSCVTMAGVWAATRVEKLVGRKDASIVVIDEVVGQLITLLFIPYFLWSYWPLIISGFLLFRAFDIWKPYPIRQLETLGSGLGIMADDVLAGVYALIVNSLVISGYLVFFSLPR